MKGFIFSAEMAFLIAQGQKTQTRRVVKPQPVGADKAFWYAGTSARNRAHFSFLKASDRNFVIEEDRVGTARPRLEVGELFYVKETLYRSENWFPGAAQDRHPKCGKFVGYAAAMSESERWLASIKPRVEKVNARNVGEDSARLILVCDEVRVERVQSIGREDAEREIGLSGPPADYALYFFQTLWNQINPEYSWELNPWVFVYSFALESPGPAKEIQAKGLDFLPVSTGL